MLALALGCGGGGGSATDSGSGTTTQSGPATDPTTSGDATRTTTDAGGPASETQSSDPTPTTGATTTTDPVLTTSGSTTDETTSSTGTTGDTTADTTSETPDTGTGTTGDIPQVCMAEVAQSFVPTGLTVDLSMIANLQSSWYDPISDRICFVDINAKGLCFKQDGTPLGSVKAPAGLLDGAIYDGVNDSVLFIASDTCEIFEVDPITLMMQSKIKLDKAKFKLDTCAGIGLQPITNNLYIANWLANEIVVLSRDGQTEIDRLDLAPAMIDGPDGINVISGTGDLLILGTHSQIHRAGIVSAEGEVVVSATVAGGVDPPLKGGVLLAPDDTLTLCATGHVWVCDTMKKCTEYMPEGGDKNICVCFTPQ